MRADQPWPRRETLSQDGLTVHRKFQPLERPVVNGDQVSDTDLAIDAHWRYSPADILKVSHHGAKESSTLGFLQRTNPQVAIISAGEGNPYGHPDAGTLRRLEKVGANVLRTDLLGSIELTSDGVQLWVKTERSP